MELRLLGEPDRPAVRETFRLAFADYAVPAGFDDETLDRLMARRGTDLAVSVGAFDEGRMVAVMATATRSFEGILSAYDTFTGVLPGWRGQRLASRMFGVARGALEVRGVRRFVLEVIESNEPAIRAYTRAGFVTRRRLDSYEVTATPRAPREREELEIAELEEPRWHRWRRWRTWNPTWQNSEDSISASVEDVACLEARVAGEPAGYAIVVPQARDLPQIAVDPSLRRRGIGSGLLAAAGARIAPGSTLRVINVEASAAADSRFFRRAGSASLPSQLEMVLDFGG